MKDLLKQSHLLRRAAVSPGSKDSLLGEGWWALSPRVTRVSDSGFQPLIPKKMP